MSFKWICPFCDQAAIITDNNYHIEFVLFAYMVGEDKMVACKIIECPNPGCNKFTFSISLHKDAFPTTHVVLKDRPGDLIQKWNLIPTAEAKVFPAYIPKPIIEDYQEACSIRDLSPKASATLSRRCLQGMIRDFWEVKEDNLYKEIEAIKDKVETATWEAINSVREVGNIGAHMEKDINLIIDVEPNEAELLINLIEILVKDWYITKYERQEKLKAIQELGRQKKSQRETQKVVKKNTRT